MSLTQLLEQAVKSNVLTSYVDKLIYLQCKLATEAQQIHPVEFMSFLQQYLDLFMTSISTLCDNPAVEERFLIQCMTFIKNVVECEEYASTEDQATLQVLSNFFTQDVVLRLCHTLVVKLFPLTLANIEDWEEHPEDFFNEEETDSWQYKKKVKWSTFMRSDLCQSCAETLYLSLLQKYQDWLAPAMMQIIDHILKRTLCYKEQI